MNSLLEFDEARHEYRLDGRIIPSVTQVISANSAGHSFYSDDPKYMLRGKRVHQATELIDSEYGCPFPLEQEIEGYLSAWKKFIDDSGFSWILKEKRIFSKEHRYAGTVDRVGFLNCQSVVLDIKTGAIPQWIDAQVGAYTLALREHGFPIDAGYGLQLKEDGMFKLKKCNLRRGIASFKYMLEIFKTKEQENG